MYSRTSNPTRDALERCIAELESGVKALAYSSGQAATAAVLDLLEPNSHVITPVDFYGGTRRLICDVRQRIAGLESTAVDQSGVAAVEAAIRPNTRLIWLESPTNPLLAIADLAGIAALARKRGILTCVDNTWATPALQRPLELGIDIVMHSATKYLGGHSDTLGGINVVADAQLGKRMLSLRSASGGVLSPWESYLVLRGIKTLSLRMAAHCANAAAIAAALQGHPQVGRVIYPGLASHPQHALAKRQMSAFGAVVSFEIRGGLDAVARFMNGLQHFAIAESLGGVESLVGHCATMSHSSVPQAARLAMGIADNLVRLSPGIEDTGDLVADVLQALG
jgi:cystathionine gamma-lyase